MNNSKNLKRNKDLKPWMPIQNTAEIGVNIKNGILTITGVADFYPRKMETDDVSNNILMVKAVLNKIENKFKDSWAQNNDDAIANEVMTSFQSNWRIPQNKIKVKFD